MSGGVGFFWQNENDVCPDLVIENGQLKFDPGLETAVLVSLFTDHFVTTEQLPPGTTNQRGWWADLISTPPDDQIGSEIWRLARSKTSTQLAALFETVVSDALQWMIDDGISDLINVDSEVIDNETIETSVNISRPAGDSIVFKYLWDGQELKVLGGA